MVVVNALICAVWWCFLGGGGVFLVVVVVGIYIYIYIYINNYIYRVVVVVNVLAEENISYIATKKPS